MIKAIETHYNGYRFRSRTEARWAVFFDSLNIPYEYEKQGYDLGNGLYYLPDFWLPQQDIFIEIKPLIYKDGEIEWPKRTKEDKLEEQSNKEVITVCGLPGEISESYSHDNIAYMCFTSNDIEHFWCVCPECGSLGIQYQGWSGRNNHKKKCSFNGLGLKNPNLNSPKLIDAYNKAKSARFEFEDRKIEIPEINKLLQPHDKKIPGRIHSKTKKQKVILNNYNKNVPGLDTYK